MTIYIGLDIRHEDARIILDGTKNVWFAERLGLVLDQLFTQLERQREEITKEK